MLFKNFLESLTSLVVLGDRVMIDSKDVCGRASGRDGREIHEFLDQVPDEGKAVDVWIISGAE